MRIACVIQRYGSDITGGSETHCRAIAERLAARHDVTVLTSCARDYVSWRNEFTAGESTVGPVRVVRFPVTRRRRMAEFTHVSDLVFSDTASAGEQERWFVENGPIVPDLLAHLERERITYDRVLFWSYRYYPSFFGVPIVPDRAILVPTAEEDPLIRAPILSGYFAVPRGYLFLTPEERDLVAARVHGPLAASEIAGIGLEPSSTGPDASVLGDIGVAPPFVLYVGRIERNKGCESLLRYFERYVADGYKPITLVMAGPSLMPIPAHPLIKPLGFVPDRVRDALLANARALIVPSPYESLSIVLLEAWNRGVPALVNAKCRVLKGQVARADGGLPYSGILEFCEGLRFLASESDVARRLGQQGLAYVDREYRWPTVMRRVEALLEQAG
jgi:glycosyltransferase involved in cell wall biosynthesis